MKQIDILCNDKIYAEMLSLELEAAGYKTEPRHTGYADIVVCEPERRIGDSCITFSETREADLTRPFDIEELISLIEERTDGVISKSKKEPAHLSFGSKYVLYQNEKIELSALEFKLLYHLYKNIGNTVTSKELSREVFDKEDDPNIVRVYISYLREKLDNRFGIRLIHTVRNKGYRLDE